MRPGRLAAKLCDEPEGKSLLEYGKSASIADTTVSRFFDLTTSLIPHKPKQAPTLIKLSLLFQLLDCRHDYTDRMPPANSISSIAQIGQKSIMAPALDGLHGGFIHSRNTLKYRWFLWRFPLAERATILDMLGRIRDIVSIAEAGAPMAEIA